MKRVFNSRQVRRCVVGSVIIWAMLVVASDNFANGPLQPTGWKLPQQQVQEFTKTIKKEFPI
ncbi:MAG TPA: hypothetical protein ENJ20_04105, partial [Bacteroidetes bacterium]|nr:hypothetical protein [Bacteroidota bacterium]